jgi:hypothetical protein
MTSSSTNIWAKVGVALALIATLYLFRVYNSFFEEQLAYVYESVGDRMYELRLGPHLATCEWWLPLVPFKHCSYSQVNLVEYKGILRERIRTLAEEQELIRKGNTGEWLKRKQAQIDRLTAEIQSGEWRNYDLAYFRSNAATPIQLPQELAMLQEFTRKNSEDVFLADIVISSSSLRGDATTSELIRNAIFVRGRAAHKVAEVLR